MYRTFFGLDTHPFHSTVDPRFYHGTTSHEEALAALLQSVTGRQGVSWLTGGPGSGKTLLAHMLVHALGSQADAVILPHLPSTGYELLRTLCRSFGIRCRSSHSAAELLDRLKKHLQAWRKEGLDALLILDHAERPTQDLLEHVRMLGELDSDTGRILQIVLIGRSQLNDRLEQPDCELFRGSISCRSVLQFLDRVQTGEYIRHRLRMAGCDRGDLFTEEAIDRIHEQSGGSPRLINQLADGALLTAYSSSCHTIDAEIVSESLRGMMAANLARTPNVSHEPLKPSAITSEARTRELTSSVLASIQEATQRGTEVLERLDEVARHAQDRAERLTTVLSQSESCEHSVARAEHALIQVSTAADERVAELRRQMEDAQTLFTELTATRARIKRRQQQAVGRIIEVGAEQQSAQGVSELSECSAGHAESLKALFTRADHLEEFVHEQIQKTEQDLHDRVERCLAEGHDRASDILAHIDASRLQCAETLEDGQSLIDRLQRQGDLAESQADHLRALFDETADRIQEGIRLAQRLTEEKKDVTHLLSRAEQTIRNLDDQAHLLSDRLTGTSEALDTLVADANRRADEIREHLRCTGDEFSEQLENRLQQGRERVADLFEGIDARERVLQDAVASGRTMIGQLEHHEGEADLRVERLCALIEEACRHDRDLHETTAGAATQQDLLSGLLTRAEESGQAFEEHARQVIQQVHDRFTAARRGVQEVLNHAGSRRKELEEVIDTVETLLARWQHSDVERARRTHEIEATLNQLDESQQSSTALLGELYTATDDLIPLLEGSRQTIDAFQQQNDDWLQIRRQVKHRFDAVNALMTSAQTVSCALHSLCGDAREARGELASQLDEVVQSRRESHALFERHGSLQHTIAAQIQQSRKAAREIQAAVREAHVTSGQASSRAQELAGSVNRAMGLTGDLDARLLRADQIVQLFQDRYDRITEATRQATRATQLLQMERTKSEHLLRTASSDRGDDMGDDDDDIAGEAEQDNPTVPRLRLRLPNLQELWADDDACDEQADSHEAPSIRRTFREAAS